MSCSVQAKRGNVQTLASVEKRIDSFVACDATFPCGKPFPRSKSRPLPANKSGTGSPTCTARGFVTLDPIARQRFAQTRGSVGYPISKAHLRANGKTRTHLGRRYFAERSLAAQSATTAFSDSDRPYSPLHRLSFCSSSARTADNLEGFAWKGV